MFVWQTQLPGAEVIFYIKLVCLIDAGLCKAVEKPLQLDQTVVVPLKLAQTAAVLLQLAQTAAVPLQVSQSAAVPLQEWYGLRKSVCKGVANMDIFEEKLYGVVVTGPEGRNTQHGEASLNSRVGGDDGDEADSVDIPAAETQALETET
uniref:Uncharacterized protein n=1 Tax=Brassica campestris TaxID=3711 RepID=A0A3P6BBV2_BRACM|nr:unnamed protein product [Brassica rapa]